MLQPTAFVGFSRTLRYPGARDILGWGDWGLRSAMQWLPDTRRTGPPLKERPPQRSDDFQTKQTAQAIPPRWERANRFAACKCSGCVHTRLVAGRGGSTEQRCTFSPMLAISVTGGTSLTCSQSRTSVLCLQCLFLQCFFSWMAGVQRTSTQAALEDKHTHAGA